MISKISITLQNPENQRVNAAAPQPSAPSVGFMNRTGKHDRRGSSGASTSYRNQTPTSESIKVELQNQSHQFIRPEDVIVSDSGVNGGFGEKLGLEKEVSTVRNRIRRFIDGN